MTPAELRAWRTARELSQEGLAQMLGVRWLAVSRWENGHRGIPPYLEYALRYLGQRLRSGSTLKRQARAKAPPAHLEQAGQSHPTTMRYDRSRTSYHVSCPCGWTEWAWERSEAEQLMTHHAVNAWRDEPSEPTP